MNVFGVGLPEMALIMVLALLVFGPKKLPEIGRSMGKAIKGFQEASREFEEEFKKEAQQIEKSVAAPMKATLEPEAPKVLTPPEAIAEVEPEMASLESSGANGSGPAAEPAETDSPA
ncbi:TatA/E family twin arginine-targeting protein translocase [Phormidium tenue]|uniref:Sec-independent protein translocase protein TatA n=1 Tax=Phormidium tenue NIES-30 TaxID=549789 RepID=A0A1U7J853_9CYAN|nr:TatA/E family twin arginine-targeting protein translocase [Phormidium tenue]MBD2231268.1 TatA/E family twin arginine-targeting protein translocase [Phormidium tenue FACHB-1052]OKH49513.1 Sec-independent protein translocase TatA [Phormidium tenue NIES-30]